MDALTIAYIAIGVHTALLENNELPAGYQGGQLEFVDTIIQHADMLDGMYEEVANDFDGVFAYEIAEPFGELYAEQWILTGVQPDAVAVANELFMEND